LKFKTRRQVKSCLAIVKAIIQTCIYLKFAYKSLKFSKKKTEKASARYIVISAYYSAIKRLHF